jgi:hypothetical protein
MLIISGAWPAAVYVDSLVRCCIALRFQCIHALTVVFCLRSGTVLNAECDHDPRFDRALTRSDAISADPTAVLRVTDRLNFYSQLVADVQPAKPYAMFLSSAFGEERVTVRNFTSVPLSKGRPSAGSDVTFQFDRTQPLDHANTTLLNRILSQVRRKSGWYAA